MRQATKYLFLSCIFFIFVSCDHWPFKHDPLSEPFPYKFQKVYDIFTESHFVDLNHDGRDECIVINNNGAHSSSPANITLLDNDFGTIDQVNFNGLIQEPFTFDWDGDGIDDIVVPYTLNDTLFIQFINFKGQKIDKPIPLFSGRPRVDNNTVYQWKGEVEGIDYKDINNDGMNELIVFPNEPYAQCPRGIFIYDGKSFQSLVEKDIGPFLKQNPSIIDIDGDQFFEFLLPTAGTDNGHEAGDTDDLHSYLFLFDYKGDILWERKFGEKFTAVEARYTDIDGNGKSEIVAFSFNWNIRETRPRIEIINPTNGNSLYKQDIPTNLATWEIIQIDRHPDKEFIIVERFDGTILLLNSKFETIRSKDYDITFRTVNSCEDLDNDGFDEILVTFPEGTLLLDHNLNIKAKYPMKYVNPFNLMQIYHRRDDKPLLAMSDGIKSTLVSLERNPWFLISFYGPSLGLIFGISLLVGLFIHFRNSRNKSHYFCYAFEKAVAIHTEPVFIVDHHMRITFANSPARQLLKIENTVLPHSIASISSNLHELASWLLTLKNANVIRHEKEIQINSDNFQILHIVAEPLEETGQARPHWLVVLQEATLQAELQKAQTWAAMAQRIAHDIKNPLTSILLTLQRLQMEYREHDHKKVKNYDHYTQKIVERIESLRRMSRGFMKFLNLQKLNLQPINLNELIENLFTSSIIVLPKDIQLEKKYVQQLPTTHLDQEQIQTVLENLLTNAINAMPEGGTLTIITSLALNLQFHETHETPQDYITIEVMDTGVGISSEMKEKLFHPFTSATHAGTGLGLTIAKKIIEDHKGHIEFSSEEGTGTSFLVYLPVA